MRQDCECCGDYVECIDGICADCRLEGYSDETTKETERTGEEAQEGEASDPSRTSSKTSQD